MQAPFLNVQVAELFFVFEIDLELGGSGLIVLRHLREDGGLKREDPVQTPARFGQRLDDLRFTKTVGLVFSEVSGNMFSKVAGSSVGSRTVLPVKPVLRAF